MSVQDSPPATTPSTTSAVDTAHDRARADDGLLQRRPGRWIDRWEPEDPQFCDAVGARTARRDLTFSILSEHIGFSAGSSGR